MRRSPVAASSMRAARPDTPSRSRSNGSSSATIVSSGIASTRPAPNSGIGTRRANTLASGGTIGWQPWVGIENRWKSVSPVASSVWNRPLASRRPARISAIVPAPPMAGTLWQTAQLAPLKAGPSPSSAVSTSRKSSSPSRNSSNSAGVMPDSGSPGSGVRSCAQTMALPASSARARSAMVLAGSKDPAPRLFILTRWRR